MAKRRTTQYPMPGEQAALHDAIIQNPDDDTVRLAYADWLQENGDEERAEFIRLQIEIARSDDSQQSALRQREVALLTQHRGDWLRQIKNKVNGASYHFRRGFPECLE